MNLKLKKELKTQELKYLKNYDYSTEPTKLTKQIEEITNYQDKKTKLRR